MLQPLINSNNKVNARNDKGEVIMYADKMTDSMKYVFI